MNDCFIRIMHVFLPENLLSGSQDQIQIGEDKGMEIIIIDVTMKMCFNYFLPMTWSARIIMEAFQLFLLLYISFFNQVSYTNDQSTFV